MVMRRRFSRRRKRTDEGRTTPIEPQWLTRAGATPALEGATLEPAQPEDVPTSFALVGVAQRGDEQRIVAVSPSSGGDALFAGLVAAARSEGDGTAVSAFAPSWDAASRRRLGALARFEPAPRALTVPTAAGEPEPIAAEPVGQPIWFEPDAVAAQASTPEARALFARALEAFRGLAAKHAGAVRAAADVAELVIMARPVATLRADGARIVLEILEPNRNAQPLTEAGVSEAMDRLEGGVRKRLNDRRTRDGEDGLRGRWIAAAESHAGLRFARRWPFSGAAAALDVAGVTADGQAVVAATREQFTLHSLGQVLDAALLAEPWIPGALAAAGAPLLPTRPRLTLIAQSFDGAAQAVLGHLGLPVSCYEIGSTEGSLRLLSELDAAVAKPAPREARREGGGNRPPRRDRQEPRERGEAGGRPARAEGGEAVEGDGAAERN
ncbi:MAG: hypothetical protein CL910_01225, partial [Deltaproteobacteria bacterium]|nr:hypothetical protein [Deltaproteobacteria bacterium]